VRRNDCLTEVLRELEGVGAEVRRGRKHLHVVWFNRDGRRRSVTISLTPSCSFASRKAAADTRRILRHDLCSEGQP
jgi:hypothetical protein